jgi:hypothetical protein
MSNAACEAARERIPELALGRLDGAERAEVLLHVHGCARCQAILDDSSGVADLLAQLAPEAEPPAGFEQRVLHEMGAGRSRDWRNIRRRILVVGGAAAAAAILSIVVVRVIDAGRATEEATTSTTNPALRTAPMVGTGGLTVGRVVVSDGASASLVVTVDYALPDGAYGLELQNADARTTQKIGAIAVENGRGTWTGTAKIPGSGSTLRMVNETGTAVCHARLEPS